MQRSFGSGNNSNGDDERSSSSNNSSNQGVVNSADLIVKETELAKREGILEERERLIAQKVEDLEKRAEQVEKVRRDLVEKLEKVSSFSIDEAKQLLLDNLEKDLTAEISKKVKAAE